MPTVDLPHGTLYYARTNAAEPVIPPLVLVHGAGGTHLDWPPQLRRFARAHVIALDLPAHGRSTDHDISSAGTRAYANAVVALLDALALPPAIIVGHSMGGAVAQQIGIHAPERVAGLVLIATGSKLPVDPTLPQRIVDAPTATIDWIIEAAWSDDASTDLKRLTRERLHSMSPAVLQADYRACKAFDVREMLDRIAAPTLVIGSDADRMVPLKFSRTLSERIPQADLVVINGAGHMLPLERPQAVTQAISTWISEQTW
jgi:pimeloyl-ACP methyl ester carboxylesterase